MAGVPGRNLGLQFYKFWCDTLQAPGEILSSLTDMSFLCWNIRPGATLRLSNLLVTLSGWSFLNTDITFLKLIGTIAEVEEEQGLCLSLARRSLLP